jgi:hypothetical protein
LDSIRHNGLGISGLLHLAVGRHLEIRFQPIVGSGSRDGIREAIETAGVEFTNGDEPA